jgi:uncharacterized membrane protein
VGLGGRAGLWLALALAVKPQPLIFVPLVLVYLLRWSGWRAAARAAGTIALTSFVLWLPYLLPPLPPQIVYYLAHTNRMFLRQPAASVSAYNLWWALGLQSRNNDAPAIGPLTLSSIGWALFAACALLALLGIWRRRDLETLFTAAGMLALAFFVLTTMQRERYLFPAIALLLIATVCHRRNLIYFLAVSTTLLLNTVIVLLASQQLPSDSLNALLDHRGETVAIAFANVLVLGVLLRILWRRWIGEIDVMALWQAAMPAAIAYQLPSDGSAVELEQSKQAGDRTTARA